MTMNVQIKYVTKNPRESIHTAIKYVGGFPSDSGGIWRFDLQKAVDKTLDGTYRYWTQSVNGGASAWVEAQQSASGKWYLRTVPDATKADNLLSLPDFPN